MQGLPRWLAWRPGSRESPSEYGKAWRHAQASPIRLCEVDVPLDSGEAGTIQQSDQCCALSDPRSSSDEDDQAGMASAGSQFKEIMA